MDDSHKPKKLSADGQTIKIEKRCADYINGVYLIWHKGMHQKRERLTGRERERERNR